MKANFKKLAFILVAITAKRANAQSSMDFSGIVPQSRVARRAGGFGFGVFGEALDFSGKKHNVGLTNSSRSGLVPQIRFGGNFYYSELDQKRVYDAPLLPPASGNSKVTVNNSLWGFNFATRLSLPYSCKVIPYLDLFSGLADFSTSLDIQPYNYIKSGSSQHLYDFASLSYGGGLGLMVPLGKYWKLDLGVTYTNFMNAGKMVDPQSARLELGSVEVDRMDTPRDMVTFKAGITYCFNSSSWSGGGYRSGCRSSGHYHSSGHCGGGHVSVHVR
jgi:hypothetical protein